MRIVVTGGSGFIGSNFLRFMIEKYPEYGFVNIDKLTYSGNKENLFDLENKENYQFFQEDICDRKAIGNILKEGDVLVNFAAESHVDNSILNPGIFIQTNVLGTQSLLDTAREKKAKLFIQISTDEVYGSLGFDQESSSEDHLLVPSSPYSASKAAAELLCVACMKTFNQPIIITRSSNNFGPYQFPEKVIPLFVTNLLKDKKVPLYGEGKNVRDWIYVQDNCEAIDFIIHKGNVGEIYNIGGSNELQNIELTKEILKQMGKDESHIEHVEDRLGHDLRYSVNTKKIEDLGWKPRFDFQGALAESIEWYKNNESWWGPLKNTPNRRTS
ncbi:MAG: dTDP-glucose 4,6-dehydratase [Nanoarchaeota archaeon]|nr:dTDP-glucose 4,6-dehydratase [Nanoarchaeota archaeon]